VPKSPRRCLLPSKPVQAIVDVFLCDNCDEEFPSEAAILAHERICFGGVDIPEAQAEPADLLGYLQLGKSSLHL